MSKEAFKEFIDNMNPESLEKTRKRMEDAIRKEAIEKAAKEKYPSKEQVFLSAFGKMTIDTHLPEREAFIVGAEFMYEWVTREYIVIRGADLQTLLDHRIKNQ